MEEAQASQSLNPHAQEFRPFSSNYSHHYYHHNCPSNYPPPPPPPTSTATTTATAITAFISPPPQDNPLLLLPHQQFQQNNYQSYPYPLNTIPHHHDHHYYYYYPKPLSLSLSLSQTTLPPQSLLHPPPLPPPPPHPPARPKPLWLKPEASGPSGSGNVCRSRRGQGCNYWNKAGLISGGRKVGSHDPQGQNGNVDHLDGTRRVWVERGEKKKKKLWGRERMKREVMPVKPQGMETTVMIRNVPNQYT